jgi:hypothetical protein
MSEHHLWCAVLMQAWDDCWSGTDCNPHERAEARKFLLDDEPGSGWRRRREEVCSLAGIDPQAFLDSARKGPRERKRQPAPLRGWALKPKKAELDDAA